MDNSSVIVFGQEVKKIKRDRVCILICFILVIFGIIITSMLGKAPISIETVMNVIVGKITDNDKLYSTIPQGIVAIVWDIRLPRILSGVFVGAGLAITGTVFQGLLMNPLADPYTIGISTGAALGATLVIYFSGILGLIQVAVLPGAFLGAMVALYIVLTIAGRSHTLSASNLIIAGIIVSSIGSAAISLIKSLSGDEVSIIVFWLMGSLASKTWEHVLILAPIVSVGGYICYRYGLELNLLCLGEENAQVYGVEVKKVRLILLITASFIVAACVSVSGIIGFVGLIIPHIIRQFLTTDHKRLIPLSALVGALLLMSADNITRSFLLVEIPVGVLTTLLGGPFFIYLFIRKDKGGFL